MKKKVVFFDMDNVLVDYESALYADKIKEQVPKYECVVDGVKKTMRHGQILFHGAISWSG